MQLVDYCRTLDAARLAGDLSGHTFDAAVLRRLMAAPDPVQDVILEHLCHVIENYRALRCATEARGSQVVCGAKVDRAHVIGRFVTITSSICKDCF